MKPRLTQLYALLTGLVVFFSLTTSAMTVRNTGAASPETSAPLSVTMVGWKDDFASATLDPRWSWIRPDATHWSLSAAPGFMRITTQTGGIYGHYFNPPNNILLADAPQAVDFQITTKVTFSPTEDTHTAGILYYQDDDNYLNLVHVHDHGTWISFHKEVSGSAGFLPYPGSVPEATVYLRIRRLGDWYFGYFSTDGSAWYLVGAQTISLTSPKIGICAYNSFSGVTEIPADFDYVELGGIMHLYLPVTLKN